MKGLLFPFDFEGKGVLDLELLVKNKAFFTVSENNPAVNSSYFLKKNCFLNHNNSSLGEPTSVLNPTIPGGPTSSSTLSSSHGGGGDGDTAGVGAVSDTNPSPSSPNAGGADSEFLQFLDTGAAAAYGGGGGGDDWGNVLPAGSPYQEQSIFGWIMEDTVEDPAIANLNKVLQIGGGGGGGLTSPEFEFGGGFGVVDQGDQFSANLMSAISSYPNNTRSIAEKTDLPIFNLINQNQAQQTQNPSLFSPLQHEQSYFGPPQAKRPNLGGPIGTPGAKWSFPDPRQQDMLAQQFPHQLLPHYLPPQRLIGPGPNQNMGELVHIQKQQQTIVDQLYNVAELVQMGNFVLAQGILARLNHFLFPIGEPFNRAAFYCKEALQLLLQTNNNNLNPSPGPSLTFSLVHKIVAYKLFSEISPLTDFTNFTCNQALLEALEGFDRIHIVDFDISYGGQWASFMQELAMRPLGPPFLKITALVDASQSAHDHLKLSLVRENLTQFASEINIEFEFEVTGLDSLTSSFFRVCDNIAVAVNLPIGCISNFNVPLPLVLRFVKQMSPRIVVSVDRGYDRTNLPFASHVIHALQSYSNILESLDAVNMNSDALQKIERFLIQPGIERVVTGRVRWPEKSQHWRNLFLSTGFSPVAFSNFAESQGECVVKRTPVRGFLVEKRQMALVLSWQRKELVSASVWRC
ncbi:hypothetical protein CASFOL_041237 [Castilleja foliolosa]|uniref:Scarecrow-like protein 6 n=1 Tax=Castilleja foliolosa TaxID=1961234 RepID=A0ABD3BDV2_9LAMI